MTKKAARLERIVRGAHGELDIRIQIFVNGPDKVVVADRVQENVQAIVDRACGVKTR